MGCRSSAEARLQSDTFLASHERQVDEWRLQQGLAAQDSLIAAEQVVSATDHLAVVRQESAIADMQAAQARATVDFLDRQFTGAELYEWMTGVLAAIYRYFLEQATATARLAQEQLGFERQQPAPNVIGSDYWAPPRTDGASAPRDRRGLTGADRLLEDVTRLDTHAFESDKRRLNISQTFSLANRLPFELQRLRDTGVLQFATPMRWYDEGFPGHYARLIKRVRLSVVALVPPGQGIRATLTASGLSRVVVGGDVFRSVVVRRLPESVALTSPIAATGVFDLDVQSEMLLPFESMGVDTEWELRLPKPANPFDFDTLADVLLTVEYTALADESYRDQVVRQLSADPRRGGERVFSLRRDFPDAWYELLNPEQLGAARTVRLDLTSPAFPSSLSGTTVEQLTVQLRGVDGTAVPATAVTLSRDGTKGTAETVLGLASTRRGNAEAWRALLGRSPLGPWELALDAAGGQALDEGRVGDVLLVVTFSGELPPWPS